MKGATWLFKDNQEDVLRAGGLMIKNIKAPKNVDPFVLKFLKARLRTSDPDLELLIELY